MTEQHEHLVCEIVAVLDGTVEMEDAVAEARSILDLADSGTGPDRAIALAFAQRRRAGTPLAHLTGRARFMGVDLVVEPGVCGVREETELLGRMAVRCLTDLRAPGTEGAELRMIDMGSGAGNLTCGVAKALPGLRVWASDLEDAPVRVTTKNVKLTGLEERVSISQGDLFAPLANKGLENTIDAIVSNPPYISAVRLQKDRAFLLDHEPRAALDGGPYGISLMNRLIKESPAFLRPGGWLLFEFGLGQERQIQSLFGRTPVYDRIEFAKNAAGQPRAVMGRIRSA